MDFFIVGAGCVGLVMAAQLTRKFPSATFSILEREPSLGGTWHHNTYPGCAVALPCVTYSMSFLPCRTYRHWFPSQGEILQYLHHVASTYEIQKHLHLNTEFLHAHWNESTKSWTVVCKEIGKDKPSEQQCRFLISAMGQLVEPSYAGIQEIDKFQGRIVHCNRWDDTVDLHGKRVVVRGNGASAAQVIPSIVHQVGSLTQLIRTPQAYSKQENSRTSPLTSWLFRNVPLFLRAWRYWNWIKLESRFSQFQRSARGEATRKGNVELCHEFTKEKAPRKYWDLLLPDYGKECKRIIGDFGYLASLHAANSTLLQDAVVRCNSSGVVAESGAHYAADVIIFATGYNTQFHHLNIIGSDNLSLSSKWNSPSPSTLPHYQTTAVAGFPNFFMLYGPNAAPPNMSAIYCFENYVDLILGVVRPILDKGGGLVEVREEAEREFMGSVIEALGEGVWGSCVVEAAEGRRRGSVYLYPWGNLRMFWETRWLDEKAWVYD
ncbi:FAD/NAD(P)-binding domain-containing protein [Byssothecium circinans]|uniref:FAD/NAD(P)-binding domain-containing protein n=1 Tax=Byssothecium circinans TaxID=147558 RepID=A0A6A5U1N2_9PLEO|nr:FAD/NAD(P)-binding domain-containing protein [Byssothecium circinans]